MSETIAVYEVNDVIEGEGFVFDKLDEALDYLRDMAFLGMSCLGDTVCLTLTQREMTRSAFDQLEEPLEL